MEAEQSVRRAIRASRALVAEHPKVSGYRNHLGNVYSHLGVLHFQMGHAKEAEQAWHRAIELQEALSAEFPEVSKAPGFRQSLAHNHNYLGAFLLSAPGRFGETEASPFVGPWSFVSRLWPSSPRPLHTGVISLTATNLGGLLRVPHRVRETRSAAPQGNRASGSVGWPIA